MAKPNLNALDITRSHQGEPELDAPDREKTGYALARWVSQGDYYRALATKWVTAILFLHNRQYSRYNSDTGRIVEDVVPEWRQQPINPLTFAVYRSALAKLLKRRPAPEVVPPSGDTEDRDAAKLGEAILEQWHREQRIGRHHKRAAGWLLCTGNVYLRVYFDPDAGETRPLTEPVEVVNPETGEAEWVDCPCNEQGEPILKPDGTPDLDAEPAMLPLGEIRHAVDSPLAVRYNPEAETPDDAYEMFVARLWPKARAAAHFKIDAAQLAGKDDDLEQIADVLADAAAAGPDLLGLSAGISHDLAIGDRVLVLEYYRKQCAEYPEGRHWIQVGHTKVWPQVAKEGTEPADDETASGEAPLPEGFWPPLIPIQDTPDPAQPHALGLLPSTAVPINESYNFIDAKILEHEDTMATGGKWFVVPEDKGLVLTSDPAQVLSSKGYALYGKPPIQAKLEALPGEVYGERSRLIDLLGFTTGLGEIGMGTKPEGVSSGRGFLVLQEVVDSVMTPTLQSFEEGYEEVYRRVLVLAQRHYSEERIVKIRGQRGQWEVRKFTGADLRDGLDVRIQTGSSFPWSKSAQMDVALSIMERFPNLINNEQGIPDSARLARFLDVGGIEAFKPEEDADTIEIEREHAAFEAINPAEGRNQVPRVAFYQNHARHYEEHQRFMRRDLPRFLRWSQPAQQAFLRHMLETKELVEQQVASLTPAGDPMGGGEITGGELPPPGGAPAPDAGMEAASAPTEAAPGPGAQLESSDFAAAGQ